MKLIKSAIILGMLAISATGFAKLKDANITLNGGPINPGQTLTIPTDKLVQSGIYSVMCTVSDPNNAKNPVILSVVAPWGMTNIYLNGNLKGQMSAQFKLPQVTNSLMFSTVGQTASLAITNLDQNDTVTVNNCVATPVIDK